MVRLVVVSRGKSAIAGTPTATLTRLAAGMLRGGLLSWRPDSESISENDEEQIASHRRSAIDLADVMPRIEASVSVHTASMTISS